MIIVKIEPRVVMTWQKFIETKSPYSIALDGFVNDATKREPTGPYANFDHHSVVDRISTRSTAEQVHMEINLGLFETFRKCRMPWANIYINDPDEDTCLASWLLINHERVSGHADPLINKLVYCSDRLDCTAGSYPFGDTSLLRKMAWMFDPYRKARSEGRLGAMEMNAIVEAVHARITAYTLGEAKELPIETSYQVLGSSISNGVSWSLVKESSTSARMAMFAAGITAFVSIISEGRYVIGCRSTWTPFPLEKIYQALNSVDGADVWGGSNTIGGCLRGGGSKLNPDQLASIINKALNQE